jgi:hypothetical protein
VKHGTLRMCRQHTPKCSLVSGKHGSMATGMASWLGTVHPTAVVGCACRGCKQTVQTLSPGGNWWRSCLRAGPLQCLPKEQPPPTVCRPREERRPVWWLSREGWRPALCISTPTGWSACWQMARAAPGGEPPTSSGSTVGMDGNPGEMPGRQPRCSAQLHLARRRHHLAVCGRWSVVVLQAQRMLSQSSMCAVRACVQAP